MQFTVRARAILSNRYEEMRIHSACRGFSSMVRSAYNARLEGEWYASVKRMLRERYLIRNARWRQWAISEADTLIKSERELLPLYVEDLSWKISRVRNKMAKTSNPLKRRGYEARIKRLEAKKLFYETHIQNKTVPKAVFGSRKLFKKLVKSKRESVEKWLQRWRHRRSNQFYSVGQALQRTSRFCSTCQRFMRRSLKLLLMVQFHATQFAS